MFTTIRILKEEDPTMLKIYKYDSHTSAESFKLVLVGEMKGNRPGFQGSWR